MLHGMENEASEVLGTASRILRIKALKCDGRKTALHRGYVLPSPTGWLRHIRDAEFVVTNSFHCVIFCLVFHVPFVAFTIDGELGSMNSRIQELLGAVGLENRILSSSSKFNMDLLNTSIDWLAVDQLVINARSCGIKFLSAQMRSRAEQASDNVHTL
jgi:hypothetical protein